MECGLIDGQIVIDPLVHAVDKRCLVFDAMLVASMRRQNASVDMVDLELRRLRYSVSSMVDTTLI